MYNVLGSSISQSRKKIKFVCYFEARASSAENSWTSVVTSNLFGQSYINVLPRLRCLCTISKYNTSLRL